MPNATLDTKATKRIELQSCPGAFVELRTLSYGEWLHRSEISMELKFAGNKNNADIEGDVAMAQRKVTQYEFSKCIVDHNLENDSGGKLNFNEPRTLDMLHPMIGSEIGDLIGSMHDFASLGNLPVVSEVPS